MKKSARRPKTQFVPRVVYRTAFASVVPLCVAGTACGGATTGGDTKGEPSVACAGFACSVGATAFDAGGGKDAAPDVGTYPSVGTVGFVASTGFGGVGATGFGVVGASAFDGGTDVEDAAERPDIFIPFVACIGFDGGPCFVTPVQDAAPDADATTGPCPGGGFGCFSVGAIAFDGGEEG